MFAGAGLRAVCKAISFLFHELFDRPNLVILDNLYMLILNKESRVQKNGNNSDDSIDITISGLNIINLFK